MGLSEFLFAGKITEIETLLASDTSLLDKPIPLPNNEAVAHPLHRLCDAVWGKSIPEKDAVAIANMMIDKGAHINGFAQPGHDSPLTAACSLRCDELALLYIDRGANIHHPGCYGGTALHWAAWCGRDRVLKKLLEEQAEVNRLCTEFKSTPLFWALHGYRFGDAENQHHQYECAQLLIEHGADRSIPNFEGYKPEQLVKDGDARFAKLFDVR